MLAIGQAAAENIKGRALANPAFVSAISSPRK